MKLQHLTEEQQKGTYAGVRFDAATTNALHKYIKDNKIPNAVPPERFHTTVLYSRRYCPNYKPLGKISPPFIGVPSNLDVWKTQDGKNALVLKYNCKDLVDRHNQLMKEHNATYDYPKYQTHITLSYDIGNLDHTTLPDVKKTISKINIVKEYGEDLDLNWTAKINK